MNKLCVLTKDGATEIGVCKGELGIMECLGVRDVWGGKMDLKVMGR